MNKVILVGNLASDPETIPTKGETPGVRFRVATSSRSKEAPADFHNVTVWGKQAEVCKQYLSKGRSVAIEGRLQTRSSEKDGNKAYFTDVVANDVQFLGSAPKKDA